MEQVLSTLAFTRFGTTLLLVLTTRDPSRADWTTWTQYYASSALEHRVRSLLVVTDGGGPNAAQRKEIVEALVRAVGMDVAEQFRTAACGDSPLVRFVNAALGWLYAARGMRTYGSQEVRKALQYLGVEEERQSEVLETALRLQSALRAKD